MSPPRTRTGQLRRRLRAHNLHVLGTTIVAVMVALGLWVAAYVTSYWLILLFLTSVFGAEARMPARFNEAFGCAALVLFVTAWILRRHDPHPRPADKKSRLAIAFDFILTLPRLTLAIPENLSAWQWLRPSDLPPAIRLIDRVRQARKFPVHSTPVEIPDDRVRERIILALLHLHILEITHDDTTAWLRLPPTPASARTGALAAGTVSRSAQSTR